MSASEDSNLMNGMSANGCLTSDFAMSCDGDEA